MINPHDSEEPRILEVSQRIAEFSAQIDENFENRAWDSLSVVLSARQTYLESILANAEYEPLRPSLEKLVDELLSQDRLVLSKLQEQKNKLAELHLLFDRGIRANKAYSSL